MRSRLQQTDDHDDTSEGNASVSSIRLPRLPLRELEEAERGQNVCQCAGAGRAHELKDDAEVARDQGKSHCGDDERGGEDKVAVGVVRFAREVVLGHDFAADEALERQSRDHVQAEA